MSEESVSLGDMVQPLSGKIAVLVNTKDEITPQGLLIPESTARSIHEERPTSGEVVAVGDEVDEVEVGDIVVFGKYTGTRLSFQPKDSDGKPDRTKPKETVIVMDERSVLAIVLTPEQAANIKVKG